MSTRISHAKAASKYITKTKKMPKKVASKLSDPSPMPLSCPLYWDSAKRVLSARDSVLATVVSQYDSMLFRSSDAFTVLLKSINGQQISIVAAEAIWQRIYNVYAPLSPKRIARLDPQELRLLGQSRQKAQYFINAAQCFLDNPHLAQLGYRDYRDVYRTLVGVKGIGLWTIEMYAIFYLNHPDIFPSTDIGILRGLKKLYGVQLNSMQAEAFSERWKPYRTVATWYLWRVLDTTIIQY